MSSITLTPKTAPTAPITRSITLPLTSVKTLLNRLHNDPQISKISVEDDETTNTITIYHEKNNGFFAIPTAYIYKIYIS